MTPRKPRPVHLTHEDVEAMIAAAVQAERAKPSLAIRTFPTFAKK